MKKRGIFLCAPRAWLGLVACAGLAHSTAGCGGGGDEDTPGGVGGDAGLPSDELWASDGGLRTPDGRIVAPEAWVPDDKPTPQAGMVARFNFDGQYPRVPDLSASGNDATFDCDQPCGNGPPPLHPGRVGYGVELAWWQRGLVPASPTLNGTNQHFTIALWLQRRIDYVDERQVLGRESEARDGVPTFALSLVDGRLSGQVGAARVNDLTKNALYRWVHVALRMDGTTLTLFRNGAAVGAVAVAAVPAAQTTPFYIGTRTVRDAFSSYADCIFDEIRLYAESLSDDAIAALAR